MKKPTYQGAGQAPLHSAQCNRTVRHGEYTAAMEGIQMKCSQDFAGLNFMGYSPHLFLHVQKIQFLQRLILKI
jgi:hypothetical protein